MTHQLKKPKFEPEDIKGQLLVINILGHSDEHPENGKWYSKRQWWYEVECDCGTREIMNQTALLKRTACEACTLENTADKICRTRRKEVPCEKLPDDVAQALRSRW